MGYSTGERIAHVFRRLGIGSYPDLTGEVGSVDEALTRSLDIDRPAPELLGMEPPLDRESATDIARLAEPVQSWLTSMVTSERLLEERMVWFWQDHFATAVQKVRIPYLMWQQHLTIRQHATGSFADLLQAVSFEPAMLFYLDGARNHSEQINENFAREVMELHTMGPGNYTQADITEAAKALTGWVVNVPYGRRPRLLADYEPWATLYVPFRHWSGNTTILGSTGPHAPTEVLDLLLEQPATAEFVSRKLWRELVGTDADEPTIDTLSSRFRKDYSILELVEGIVGHPDFISESAIRARIRTPVERLVSIARGFGSGNIDERLGFTLHEVAYLPFNPPSPAGYPKGRVLLGPHQMIHSFDLLAVASPDQPGSTDEILFRAGIVDVSKDTRRLVDLASEPGMKTAMVVNSPEFALT